MVRMFANIFCSPADFQAQNSAPADDCFEDVPTFVVFVPKQRPKLKAFNLPMSGARAGDWTSALDRHAE